MKKWLPNLLLALVCFLLPLCLLEWACLALNRAEGVKLPYLAQGLGVKLRPYANPDFTILDVQLAYTRGKDFFQNLPNITVAEKNGFLVVRSAAEQTLAFKDGFVFLPSPSVADFSEPFSLEALPRPFIMVLGGSTSQTMRRAGIPSWPEKLAVLMEKKGVKGTIINGALDGYSTNQELLQLIRDGLALDPDAVLAYHGVNDVKGVDPKHPLTTPFMQRNLNKLFTPASEKSPLLPNTVYRIASLLKPAAPPVTLTFGPESSKSLAESFVNNARLMDAILKARNIRHISIQQPFILSGRYGESMRDRLHGLLSEYDRGIAGGIVPMYEEVAAIRKRGDVPMLDMTTLFDGFAGSRDVYYDWCHVNEFANEYLAQKMFELLFPEQ